MSKTLTFLVATTALAAAIGLPAWSALRAPVGGGAFQPLAALLDGGHRALPRVLVSDDDDRDDDEDHDGDVHDDEDHDGEDHDGDVHDDDDCDDDDCRGSARNPAPAGAVAPPRNGLFGTGAPPQVQVN